MIRRACGTADRALVRDEACELVDLAGDEAAFLAALGVLDDVAHLAEGQLDLLERDAGLELELVEKHFAAEGDTDGVKHGAGPFLVIEAFGVLALLRFQHRNTVAKSRRWRDGTDSYPADRSRCSLRSESQIEMPMKVATTASEKPIGIL